MVIKKFLPYCTVFIMMLFSVSSVLAQVQQTATPITVIIPTQTPLPTEITVSTPTPTITPTEQGFVLLIASDTVDSSIPINVRRLPDPIEEVVGFLDRNTEYVVTGRYVSWWQIEYDTGGNRAWVFNSVVELIGEASDVPTVDPFIVPTATPFNPSQPLNESDFAATLAVITQTPDAILTVTAQQRVIDIPQTSATALAGLPTFTPPPESELATGDTLANISQPDDDDLSQAFDTLVSGQLPPIFPILILAGAGIVGFLLSLLFRR